MPPLGGSGIYLLRFTASTRRSEVTLLQAEDVSKLLPRPLFCIDKRKQGKDIKCTLNTGVPMTDDNRPLPGGLDALRQRFESHSRKAQAYYAVMHEARDLAGNDNAASEWMEKALPAFDGKSPAALVNEGRSEEVLAYLGSLKG
jgi:hypothetical protein